MKYFLIALIIIVIYLTRTYAYFYNFLDSHYSNPPETPQNLLVGNVQSSKPLKYVAIGDSLTAGVGTDAFQYTYPYLVAQNLAKMQGEVELTNLGVPGYTTLEVIKSELPMAISDDPDYVTILIGTNDIQGYISLSNFQKNYASIVKTLTSSTHAKITLITIPFLGSGKILYPPYSYLLNERIKQFNSVILQIARQNNVPVIDLYSQTKNSFSSNNNLYSNDQFHPSSEGYALWGTIIHAN